MTSNTSRKTITLPPPTHSLLYKIVYTVIILLPIIMLRIAFYFDLHWHLFPWKEPVQVTRFNASDLRNRTTLEPAEFVCPDWLIVAFFYFIMVVEIVVGLVMDHHVFIPLIFKKYSPMHYRVVFGHSLWFQKLCEIKVPDKFEGVNAFYLPNGEDIKLGVWHIPPQEKTFTQQGTSRAMFALMGRLVVLYAHGCGGDRSNATHLYRKINRMGCHVVAFDYRGFVDSSSVTPTADTITSDTRAVYEWILGQDVPPNRVILWGHSLGTAVVVRLLSTLPRTVTPLATVLEAPFTSIADMTTKHILAKLFCFLPHFDLCFRDPLVTNPDTNFDSIACLPSVHCPLLILHAEDDRVVPIEQARKLYETALQVQSPDVAKHTQLVVYEAKHKYGHVAINSDPKLSSLVKQFVVSLL